MLAAFCAPRIARGTPPDGLPRNLQLTPPTPQRDYWSTGFVFLPIDLEGIALGGRGYSVAGGGAGMGVHVGVSRKIFVDGSFHGDFGSGSVVVDGARESANLGAITAESNVGGKIFIRPHAFGVVYAGVAYGESTLSWAGSSFDSPFYFAVVNRSVATPLGGYVNFGRDAQVIPWLAISRVWSSSPVVSRYTTTLVRTKTKLDPFESLDAGIDTGSARNGVYFGIQAHVVPAVADNSAMIAFMLHLTWSLRGGKAGSSASK